jgi:RNA polymerase sigma-B factor
MRGFLTHRERFVTISASAPTLLREWELLQSDVIPALLTDSEQPPTAWAMGSIDDAVALAVAFEHAQPSGGCELMDVYTSETAPGARETGFALADLRGVPAVRKSGCLVRLDRRWVAGVGLAEHVYLADPSDPVDLVTVRANDARSDALMDEAVEQLRPGGQLLVITAEAGRELPMPAGVQAVGANGNGRVYRKCGRTRSRSRSGCHSRMSTPPETLAHRRAQRELVEAHVRLARSLARRFAHHGEPTDDLEQVAMLALVKAAKRFDPERNTRFATYATSSILGELKRHFRDKTWMLRVPRPVQELYLSVKQTRDELTHELSTNPTNAQIAERLGVTEQAVLSAVGAGDNFWPASLDGRVGEESGIEVPVHDESFDQCLDRLQVQASLPGLDDRERFVLKRVYFDDSTQREVAADLGVSQMQVSRLLAQAVNKLRA